MYGGVHARLLADIAETLFGEPARRYVDTLLEYSPCQVGMISKRSGFSINETKTLTLAMYIHGVVSVVQENGSHLLTLNSLPLLILSAPSVLMAEIESAYSDPELYSKILKFVMLNGIVDIDVLKERLADDNLSADDINRGVTTLLQRGLLTKRIVPLTCFSSQNVGNVQRRIDNLQLISRRTRALKETADKTSISDEPFYQVGGNEKSVTISWEAVTIFLRDRFVVQLGESVLGEGVEPLLSAILELSKGSDYRTYRALADLRDEVLRDRTIAYPTVEALKLIQRMGTRRDDVYKDVDKICASQMKLLRGENGAFWTVTVPEAIKVLQFHYIEAHCEQFWSPYHRRCFNQMRYLEVGETHQIESLCLLSEKDARSALYNLARVGFIQIQGINRSANDTLIGPRSIFVWRFDESSALEAYRTIIGEHCRRLLSKISALTRTTELNPMRDGDKKGKAVTSLYSLYADALKVFILFSEM